MVKASMLPALCLLVLSAGLAFWNWDAALAQTSKKGKSTKKKPVVNTQPLDIKAEQLQSNFVKEAEGLASEYFEAGSFEKAKILLKTVQTLKPNDKDIEAKLRIINETILTANDFEVDIDSGKGWEPVGTVYEQRPLRFQAAGTYKFYAQGTLGPNGYPNESVTKDYIPGLPCGALIGIILNQKDKKLSKPFLIGESVDFTPSESGILHIKVNGMPENRNTGKLKVAISGYITAPGETGLSFD